jgi:hypothetical protein
VLECDRGLLYGNIPEFNWKEKNYGRTQTTAFPYKDSMARSSEHEARTLSTLPKVRSAESDLRHIVVNGVRCPNI